MKKAPFKMKSPLLKDVKMYEGSGSQITIDDKSLGKTYMDEHGNKARDYSYTTKDGEKATDTLYLNKPRFEGPAFEEGEGPEMPRDKPIEYKPNLA